MKFSIKLSKKEIVLSIVFSLILTFILSIIFGSDATPVDGPRFYGFPFGVCSSGGWTSDGSSDLHCHAVSGLVDFLINSIIVFCGTILISFFRGRTTRHRKI